MELSAQRPAVNSVTRHLCAGVFNSGLGGVTYRHKLREFFRDHIHAVAPSPGVDIQLLRCVLRWASRRSLLFHSLITAIGLITLGFLGVTNPLLFVESDANTPQPSLEQVVWILVFQAVVGYLWYRHVYQGMWSIPIKMFGSKTCNADAIWRKFGRSRTESTETSPGDVNVVVYHGFSPFVGFGFEVSDWSLVVDTSKPSTEQGNHQLSAVTVDELYQQTSAGIRDLHIPDLSINDLIFVDGREVRRLEWLLPDPFAKPLSAVDPSIISNYLLKQHSENNVRAYRSIRTAGWDSELELQSLFRFTLLGPMLTVEGKQLLLTPIDERYRRVDNLAPLSWLRRIMMLLVCIALAGILIAVSALLLLSALNRLVADLFEGIECRRRIKRQPEFDYGAKEGLRATFSSPKYLRYYQKIDKQAYGRAIEKRFLDTIIEFLDSKGIDTSDLDTQKTLLVNSGVLIQGGITAEAVAVGEGSKATKSTGIRRASKKGANGG